MVLAAPLCNLLLHLLCLRHSLQHPHTETAAGNGHCQQVRREADGKTGGTHLPGSAERCWGRQQFIASNVYNTRWAENLLSDALPKHVRWLNLKHLKLIDSSQCPFSKTDGGCDVAVYEPKQL